MQAIHRPPSPPRMAAGGQRAAASRAAWPSAGPHVAEDRSAYGAAIFYFCHVILLELCSGFRYLRGMTDQIIDAAAAQELHAYARRAHMEVAWVVMKEQVDHPDEFVARLVTNASTPYVLLAGTLTGLQSQLPFGLACVERQPADPSDLVEIWLME